MSRKRRQQQTSAIILMVMVRMWVFLFVLGSLTQLVSSQMIWQPRKSYPGDPRHHPITFANETHGFLLTGSTLTQSATRDMYMYIAAIDLWVPLENTPIPPRSFGYGVVLNEIDNTKAYVGMGKGIDDNGNDIFFNDLWEFDMSTLEWQQLANMPGPGRRHPAMNAVLKTTTARTINVWEIHVGLGDGQSGNYNDWYIYDISANSWTQAPNLPAIPRHHPFYFALGSRSYDGLGHSSDGIERDWWRLEPSLAADGEWTGVAWVQDPDFVSYTSANEVNTTEARVAGTQFAIGNKGFVLSGDGDDHGAMETGEFHYYLAPNNNGTWQALPPHPGNSRWAPGSFVLRGSTHVYFTSGYDRVTQTLFNDLWTIDVTRVFSANELVQYGLLSTTSAPTSSFYDYPNNNNNNAPVNVETIPPKPSPQTNNSTNVAPSPYPAANNTTTSNTTTSQPQDDLFEASTGSHSTATSAAIRIQTKTWALPTFWMFLTYQSLLW